jgi:hypothetical protein
MKPSRHFRRLQQPLEPVADGAGPELAAERREMAVAEVPVEQRAWVSGFPWRRRCSDWRRCSSVNASIGSKYATPDPRCVTSNKCYNTDTCREFGRLDQGGWFVTF